MRGVLIGSLLLLAFVVTSSSAMATSDIELKHAPDGTLLVVGSGWRRHQELVIDLGKQQFSVRADASGEFELATGLASYHGALTVHHPEPESLAFAALPTSSEVSPLAVDLARSLAEGLVLLGALTGAALIGAGVARHRGWRRP